MKSFSNQPIVTKLKKSNVIDSYCCNTFSRPFDQSEAPAKWELRISNCSEIIRQFPKVSQNESRKDAKSWETLARYSWFTNNNRERNASVFQSLSKKLILLSQQRIALKSMVKPIIIFRTNGYLPQTNLNPYLGSFLQISYVLATNANLTRFCKIMCFLPESCSGRKSCKSFNTTITERTFPGTSLFEKISGNLYINLEIKYLHINLLKNLNNHFHIILTRKLLAPTIPS